MFSNIRNIEQGQKVSLKQKIQKKCMEDRSKYAKNLFASELGKALLEAIRKKAKRYAADGETDKTKIGNKIVSSLIKTKSSLPNELSSVLKMCRLMRGKYQLSPKFNLYL